MTKNFPKTNPLTLADVKQAAKRLLRDLKAGSPEAIARLAVIDLRYRQAPEVDHVKLNMAQLVIARESGFASWPRLKHWFDWKEGRDVRLQTFRTDADYFSDRANGLIEMLQVGDERAREQVRLFHPRYKDLNADDSAWTVFETEDAKLVIAGQHGFETWQIFATELHRLNEQPVLDHSPFRRAYDAIEAADLEGLTAAIAADPVCIEQSGTNGNSLLNLAAGALVTPDLSKPPSERNTEPDRRMALIDALLAAGAAPDQANQKGWTALHQAAYNNNPDLAKRLLAAGATVDLEAYDTGGTPLVVALWWGHDGIADYLAEYGITPNNMRVAAGLGRVDALKTFFDRDGKPTAAADQARGFHRPHSGFPAWQPIPGHRQEILDDALSFAVRNGRLAAMALLVERGADVNGIACNGSLLEWAVIKGRTDVVTWLLDHGAEVNMKADFARNRGQTALHSAAFADHLDLFKLLVEAGADPTMRDDVNHSTPLGWALYLNRPATVNGVVEACWDQCSLDDLIMAGASLQIVTKRLDADPNQLAGWTGTGTSLRAAAAAGREDIVRFLLARGADLNGKSREGKSALDLAHEAGHSQIANLLSGVDASP